MRFKVTVGMVLMPTGAQNTNGSSTSCIKMRGLAVLGAAALERYPSRKSDPDWPLLSLKM